MTEDDKEDEQELILLTDDVAEMEHTPELFRGALTLYSREIIPTLEQCGFSKIRAISGDEAPNGPHYTAMREGHRSCICMQPVVTDILELTCLTEEQCNVCDEAYARRDIYFSALVENEGTLYLHRPVLLRRKGEWLSRDETAENYLPPSKLASTYRLRTLIGAALEFKLWNLFVPYVMTKGNFARIRIHGLGEQLEERPDHLVRAESMPYFLAHVKETGEKRCDLCQCFFYYEHEERLELELIRRVGDDPETGLVELIEERGTIIYAECVEAALLPTKLRMPLRYTWSLSLVAERIQPHRREITITSGPLFEDSRAHYREEHGEEPPTDYAVNISLENLRRIHQREGSPRAMVTGRIVALRETEFFFRPFTIATVLFLPEDEHSVLRVIISHELLAEYRPKVGDVISCNGVMQAVPDSTVEDGESWRDDPGLLQKKEERENEMEAMAAFQEYAVYSIGYAAVMAAFISAGWSISCNVLYNGFARHRSPLIMQRGEGEQIIILPETIINGHEPVFSFREIDDFFRLVAKCFPALSTVVCYAFTSLDYNPTTDRYKVAVRLEPEVQGVQNTLVSCACPFREFILTIGKDGTSEMKRERPEVLDEAHAAELLFNAFTKSEWTELAKWMREELDYISDSTKHRHFFGKIDFLRYISERIERWSDDEILIHVSTSIGYVMVDGIRRPATALHNKGRVSNVTIFSDSHGLIGAMRSLPPEYFSAYVRETELTPMVSPQFKS